MSIRAQKLHLPAPLTPRSESELAVGEWIGSRALNGVDAHHAKRLIEAYVSDRVAEYQARRTFVLQA